MPWPSVAQPEIEDISPAPETDHCTFQTLQKNNNKQNKKEGVSALEGVCVNECVLVC